MSAMRAALRTKVVVLAALCGCGGRISSVDFHSDPPGVAVTLATNPEQFGACAADRGAVYCSACSVSVSPLTDCITPQMTLVRVPLDGTPPSEMTRNDGGRAWLVAAGGGFVYWVAADAKGTLRRMPEEGGAVETLLVAADNQWSLITGLAIGQSVYLMVEDGQLHISTVVLPLEGGTPRTISVDLSSHGYSVIESVALASDDTALYYASPSATGYDVRRSPLNGTLTTIASRVEMPRAVTLQGQSLFWVEADGTIVRADKNGGPTAVVVAGLGAFAGLVVDARSVYFIANQDGTFAVSRAPLVGGDVEQLAIVPFGTNQLFGDDDDVYWAEASLGGGANAPGLVAGMRKP